MALFLAEAVPAFGRLHQPAWLATASSGTAAEVKRIDCVDGVLVREALFVLIVGSSLSGEEDELCVLEHPGMLNGVIHPL